MPIVGGKTLKQHSERDQNPRRSFLDYALHQPSFIATNLRDILLRPSWYAKTYISDVHSVPRALSFYLKIFSLMFAVALLTQRVEFASERSELRMLVPYALQALFATLLVYCLLRPFSKSVYLATVFAIVLYVDAAYILVERLAYLPIAFFDFRLNTVATDKDLYFNAVEACLAHDSFLYLFMNGPIEHLLYDEHRYNSTVLASFIGGWYWRYIVALPILAVFGKFIAAKYDIHWLIGSAVGLIALAACVEGYWRLDGPVLTSIVNNSDCHERMVDQVTKEYRPEVLAQQNRGFS